MSTGLMGRDYSDKQERTKMPDDTMKSVSDMMRALQNEIEQVKNGGLAESTARVVFKGRDLQLKTAALNLQFLRLNKGKMPDEMPLLSPGKKSET